MAIATNIGGFFAPSFLRSKPPRQSIPNFQSSPSLSIPKSTVSIFSPRVSSNPGKVKIVACTSGKHLDEGFGFNSSTSSSKEASFDLKLPRRRLLVQFTCNACGERTERTINRVAYERGTVFVQCAGCLVNHKLVDNLGLVVEYDLRKEIDLNSDLPRGIDAGDPDAK